MAAAIAAAISFSGLSLFDVLRQGTLEDALCILHVVQQWFQRPLSPAAGHR